MKNSTPFLTSKENCMLQFLKKNMKMNKTFRCQSYNSDVAIEGFLVPLSEKLLKRINRNIYILASMLLRLRYSIYSMKIL